MSDPIWLVTFLHSGNEKTRLSWSNDLGLRPFSLAATNLKKISWLEMGEKYRCFFAHPLLDCSSTLFIHFVHSQIPLASTHSYSAHIRLLSQCTSHVSYSRLTVWDGLSAFSHQLCHGVHNVVQNSVVPFCSPPMLCSTLQVQHSTVWVQTSKVHIAECSAVKFSHQHRHGIPLSLLKSNISPLLTPRMGKPA